MDHTTPTDAAKDLVDVLNTRLSVHSVRRIMRSFIQTNQWSPREAVDQNGSCLLTVWMDHLLRGTFQPPDRETLDLLLDGRSMQQFLERPSFRGRNSLGEAVLEKLGAGDSNSAIMDFLWSDQVFGAMSTRQLENMPTRGYQDNPLDDRRLNALRAALDSNQVGAARKLLERGWSWKAPSGKTTPAVHIQSPAAWELFLESGGNAFTLVNDDTGFGNCEPKPLWRYLLERTSDDKLKAIVKDWAEIYAKDSLAKKAEEDYWRKIDHSYSISEVMKAIRSRKNWQEMKNSDGENVLFFAMRRHPSVISNLAKVGKAKPLFSEIDNRGAGFWHHLLTLDGKSVSAGDWKMAREHANPRPDPGKGILVTLLDLPAGFDQKSLPTPESLKSQLVAGKAGVPTVEDWWAGSKEDLAKLGLFLQGHCEDGQKRFYWGSPSIQNQGWFSPSMISKNLSALLRAFPVPMDSPPELLGGLALNELMTSRTRPSEKAFELFDELVAAGAAVFLSPEASQNLEKILSQSFDKGSSSRYHQLIMETELSCAPMKESKSALRL